MLKFYIFFSFFLAVYFTLVPFLYKEVNHEDQVDLQEAPELSYSTGGIYEYNGSEWVELTEHKVFNYIESDADLELIESGEHEFMVVPSSKGNIVVKRLTWDQAKESMSKGENVMDWKGRWFLLEEWREKIFEKEPQ